MVTVSRFGATLPLSSLFTSATVAPRGARTVHERGVGPGPRDPPSPRQAEARIAGSPARPSEDNRWT